MKLLLDTNLILDLVLNRPKVSVIKQVFLKAEENKDEIFITASSVTDLFYIIRKTLHNNRTYEVMEDIFSLVRIIPVTEEDILSAFFAKWKDFEDCVQFVAAQNYGIDFVITWNKKDFEINSNVLLPEEYIFLQ